MVEPRDPGIAWCHSRPFRSPFVEKLK
jgi:hypothetical protein